MEIKPARWIIGMIISILRSVRTTTTDLNVIAREISMIHQTARDHFLETMKSEINIIIQTVVRALLVLLIEETPFTIPPRINLHNEIQITTSLLIKRTPLAHDQEHLDVSDQIRKQYSNYLSSFWIAFYKIPFQIQ